MDDAKRIEGERATTTEPTETHEGVRRTRERERPMTPAEMAFGRETTTEAVVWLSLDGVPKGSFQYKGGFLDDEIHRHCGGSGQSKFLVLLHDWEEGNIGQGTKGICKRFYLAVDGPPRPRADAWTAPPPVAAPPPAPAMHPDMMALYEQAERRATEANERMCTLLRDLALENAKQKAEVAEDLRKITVAKLEALVASSPTANPTAPAAPADPLGSVRAAVALVTELRELGGKEEKEEHPILGPLVTQGLPRALQLADMYLGYAIQKHMREQQPEPPKPTAPAGAKAAASLPEAKAEAKATAAPKTQEKAAPKAPERKQVRGRMRGRRR